MQGGISEAAANDKLRIQHAAWKSIARQAPCAARLGPVCWIRDHHARSIRHDVPLNSLLAVLRIQFVGAREGGVLIILQVRPCQDWKR